jgi:hypothetical protein
MKVISEQAIEAAAAWLDESEDRFEQTIQQLQEEQPVLLSYLFSETFDAFTHREKEFFLYLTLVTYLAVTRETGEKPFVTEEQLSKAEEHNWALTQGIQAKRFHERLDVFFEDSPQEELLAFAEDALSDESDEWVTKEGREALFISLKSIVDCLT